MEMQFMYWSAMFAVLTVAVIGGFGGYLLTYHRKHGTLPKSKIPYILLGIIIITYSLGVIRITPPEVQQRTIRTYDTSEIYNIPEIELKNYELYKPELEK